MKKKMIYGVVLGGLLVATTGCAEHTFNMGTGAPTAPLVYEEWHHHWLAGLIGERTLDLEAECPSGNATIHDEQSFLNGLVSVLTGGIYTPTTVTIRCEMGASTEIELEESDLMTILSSPAFLDRVEDLAPHRFAEAELGVRALLLDR
jgi:hypothetical protein